MAHLMPELVLEDGAIGWGTGSWNISLTGMQLLIQWNAVNQTINLTYVSEQYAYEEVSNSYLQYELYRIRAGDTLSDVGSIYQMKIIEWTTPRGIGYAGVRVGFAKVLPAGEYQLKLSIYTGGYPHTVEQYLTFQVPGADTGNLRAVKQNHVWVPVEQNIQKSNGVWGSYGEYVKIGGVWCGALTRPELETFLPDGQAVPIIMLYNNDGRTDRPGSAAWNASAQTVEFKYTGGGTMETTTVEIAYFHLYTINQHNALTDVSAQYTMAIDGLVDPAYVNRHRGVRVRFSKTLPAGEYELQIGVRAGGFLHEPQGYLNFTVS